MDIKDLNKSQLILLAVLLSFITSIATGITTVTLMQQAPPTVTVPVNRIVRQTVEKIQQVEGKTTVQTVVVKEEDLVVDAIAKNKDILFSVSKEGVSLEGDNIEIPIGHGFAVSTDGVVVVDAQYAPGKDSYYVKNASGKFKASFLGSNKGVTFLKIGEPVDGTSKISFVLPTAADINTMKAGQKILSLGDSISSIIFEGDKDLKLSIAKSNAGGLVLNLDGEALGIALSNDAQSFASMEEINTSFKALEAPKS